MFGGPARNWRVLRTQSLPDIAGATHQVAAPFLRNSRRRINTGEFNSGGSAILKRTSDRPLGSVLADPDAIHEKFARTYEKGALPPFRE